MVIYDCERIDYQVKKTNYFTLYRLFYVNLLMEKVEYLKEPKGINFVIKSVSLTKKEKREISLFITKYKATVKKTV
ncbi:hypothetical protein AD998_20360 [bacterium 336/3]|nr:hypothetical protein AD998_20360 [bacterium 336/3]